MPSQRHIERYVLRFFWWCLAFLVLAGLNHLFGWWKPESGEGIPNATGSVRRNTMENEEGLTLREIGELQRPYLFRIMRIIVEMRDAGLIPGGSFRFTGNDDEGEMGCIIELQPHMVASLRQPGPLSITHAGRPTPLD